MLNFEIEENVLFTSNIANLESIEAILRDACSTSSSSITSSSAKFICPEPGTVGDGQSDIDSRAIRRFFNGPTC